LDLARSSDSCFHHHLFFLIRLFYKHKKDNEQNQ
jgi:hypothetical protein